MKPTVRCSSLPQLLNCSGSRTLGPIAVEKGMAVDMQEAITTSGSWTHFRAGLRLVMAAGAVGEPEKPAGPEPIVDTFESWVEDYYYDTVLSYTSTAFAIAVERRITVEFEKFILTGQIDCFTINADATEADINDLKTGYIPVTAAEFNWQLFGYLVLLLRLYPTLKKVRLRIIQPRNAPEERVSDIELEVTPDLEATLVAEIEAALEAPDELNTGRKQCRWCIAQLICPALKQLREAMKMKLTKESLAAIVETPNDVLLGEWVRDGKMLTAPIEASRELMKARIAEVGAIILDDGTELFVKEVNGQRKVPDNQAIRDRLQESGIDYVKVANVSFDLLESQVAAGVLIDGEMTKLPKSSKKPDVLTAPIWITRNLSDLYEQPRNKQLVVL